MKQRKSSLRNQPNGWGERGATNQSCPPLSRAIWTIQLERVVTATGAIPYENKSYLLLGELGKANMAQKRMISSAIWEDENFGKLSVQARLLFIGLITNADDDGFLRANCPYLRSSVFIYDDISLPDMQKYLDEIIANCPSVHLYKASGNAYLHFVKWTTYQTLRADRKKDTMMPPCPTCGCQTDNQMTAEYKVTKDKLNEINGREVKKGNKLSPIGDRIAKLKENAHKLQKK